MYSLHSKACGTVLINKTRGLLVRTQAISENVIEGGEVDR
jgi:hypothetical protein